MLMDLLSKVATTALLGFVVSSMMAMGVGFTLRQIIDALHDVRLVLLALLANFVAIPLGALALHKMLGSTSRWRWACCCLARQPARHSCPS